MKKISIVFGTRPEAIKMCPLVLELKKYNNFDVKTIVTGQHREMLDQVLSIFNVVPDIDMSIMKKGQTLSDITMIVMSKLYTIFGNDKPDIVLVHGDTTTAFAAALASFYMKIPVGHVEAGLRTYDKNSPYPEEFNRQGIGIIADYHFAPTKMAYDNLVREGKKSNNIYITGNTVIDALKYTVSSDFQHPELTWSKGSRLIFLTCHRRENIGKPMENIFRAIKRIARDFNDCKIVYPVHLNPDVKELAYKVFQNEPNVHLINPLNVIECHNFEANCYLCVTDSGGIQEECPYFGKPVLVLRNTTERPEGIKTGTLKLVGTNENGVYKAISELLNNENVYKSMSRANNPYGDGNASKRIADILMKIL